MNVLNVNNDKLYVMRISQNTAEKKTKSTDLKQSSHYYYYYFTDKVAEVRKGKWLGEVTQPVRGTAKLQDSPACHSRLPLFLDLVPYPQLLPKMLRFRDMQCPEPHITP